MRNSMRTLSSLGLIFLALLTLSSMALSQDIFMNNNTTANASATIDEDSCPASLIIPPSDKPGGLTYGEWNAKWWQWAYSMPIDEHPLFDTADCGERQSKGVWFLGSKFTSEQTGETEFIATVNRKCTIPPETMLFFPVMNVEGSQLEGNGETEDELREYAKWIMAGHAFDMFAEIDGCPVEISEEYLAPSQLFTFGPLPKNNVLQELGFDAPKGTTSISVANGYYLMLAPLSVGKHTIHFGGTFKFTEEEDGFDFTFKQDVTYRIAVKRNWDAPRMLMSKNLTQKLTQLEE